MATKLPLRLFASSKLHIRCPPRCVASARPYSSEAASPPYFTKLKGDLKTALKAKDTARLNVLRSVISAVNNASKTTSPIKTDIQLVGLLRRHARASSDAAEEFRAAGRTDLVEKEDAHIKIYDEYAEGSGVRTLGHDEITAAVAATVAEIQEAGGKPNFGEVSKRLFVPGSKLDGMDYDRKLAAEIIKKATT